MFKVVETIVFSIFAVKQMPQESIVQIIDAINGFINNPLFAEYGRIGLFINGVLSTFIPFPPELTAISLVFAGMSRIEILIILVTSWIIGAALGYYAGLYGKKLVAIFKGRRKETKKAEKEEEANADNNKPSSEYNHTIHNNATDNDRLNRSKNEVKHSRYRQLLERYGWAIIFVSPWIPVLGDIIPVIAGAKRYDFKKFMIAIAAGKIVRAVAMIFLGSYLASISSPPWI
ncbi:MAG: VTT domain-containing protein [Thermoproteota archaeon]|nr:VTT domain-containing protein [Thermoproteota archaeon]